MNNLKEEGFSTAEILESKKAKIRKGRSLRSMLFELVFTSAAIFVLVFVIFGFASVDGNSMYPTSRDGDLVMIYRLEKGYKANDVITFELNNKKYIKRVVAVAGDVVNIDNESGYLIVNGSVMNEGIMFPTTSIGNTVTYPYTVPENSVFALGDNREDSTDSRVFSAIPIDKVSGKVMLIVRTRIM